MLKLSTLIGCCKSSAKYTYAILKFVYDIDPVQFDFSSDFISIHPLAATYVLLAVQNRRSFGKHLSPTTRPRRVFSSSGLTVSSECFLLMAAYHGHFLFSLSHTHNLTIQHIQCEQNGRFFKVLDNTSYTSL